MSKSINRSNKRKSNKKKRTQRAGYRKTNRTTYSRYITTDNNRRSLKKIKSLARRTQKSLDKQINKILKRFN